MYLILYIGMFVKYLIYTAAFWRQPRRGIKQDKHTLRRVYKLSLITNPYSIKHITKIILFSPNYPNIIYIFKTFVYGFWIFLGIFPMFLYLTNQDILGIIQDKMDLTKEKLFDMGFGNWVGLNCSITIRLLKMLHNPFHSTFPHQTHMIILSVIYYCG